MAISATTLALIGAGVAAAGATAGAAGSAANRKKARREEARNYQNAKDYLTSMYYRDPLSTVGNRSLLKLARENYEDNLEALNNRMVAGGATMENALAARKASNEGMDKLYGQLLQGEDARRDRIDAQRLQLEDKHSGAVQSSYMQAAQDWNQWGGQMAQAGMSLMSSGLLSGAGGGKVPTFGDVAANSGMTNPIINQVDVSGVNAPTTVDTPSLGGLKGVTYNNGIPGRG